MNILLIHNPPAYNLFSISEKKHKNKSVYPPLNLLYIASSLISNDHKVEIIDFLAEKNPLSIIYKKLKNIDIVGISTYTRNYQHTDWLVEQIKKYNPNIPIILGGPHCIFNPDDVLSQIKKADISVDGEGEIVINQILHTIENDNDLSKIDGIHYRKNSIIKKTKKPKIFDNIDSIPFPSRNLILKYDYGKIGKINFYKPKFTTMLTIRGCPYKCKFCTRNVETMKYRKRSIENVLKELQIIDEKYSSLTIVDDNFLADKKRAENILDGIIKTKIDLEINILGIRADNADLKLFQKMKKAGVKQLFFGIESGNQEILDFYNKNITLNQIRRAIHLSRKMGFFTIATFILGAPSETYNQIENTIKFACSLPIDLPIFLPLNYQRGSDLWSDAVKLGKIKNYESEVIADKNKGLGNFSEKELKYLCRTASKKFFFRPKYITKMLISNIKDKNPNLIKFALLQNI